MNELHYQLDLLKAMNQKLSARERMYRFVCDASRCGYLYYSFEKNEYSMLGKWQDFFDFEVHGTKDLEHLFDEVEEPFMMPLRTSLFPEKEGKRKRAGMPPSRRPPLADVSHACGVRRFGRSDG